jgi:hypothetical protein
MPSLEKGVKKNSTTSKLDLDFFFFEELNCLKKKRQREEGGFGKIVGIF